MVEFLHVRRWENGNKTNFYWAMLLVASVVYNMEVLEHFVTKNYKQRLDIVQKSSLIF